MPRWAPLVMLALFAGVAAGNVPETREYADSARKIVLELPATWEVKPIVEAPFDLVLSVGLPDGGARARLSALHLDRGPRRARAQAYMDRGPMALRDKATASTVHLDVVPHLELAYVNAGGTECRRVVAYRVLNGRSASVQIVCDAEIWPTVREPFLAAAAAMTTDLPTTPATPDSFERVEADGIVYDVHPNVGKRTLAAFQKLAAERFGRWSELHGDVGEPGVRPVIVILDKPSSAARLSTMAAARDDGIASHLSEGRTFAVPPRKKDRDARARLAHELSQLFHVWAYGNEQPAWLVRGEAVLAWSEAFTGRELPSVSESVAEPPAMLPELAESYGGTTAWVWAAYLRAGPKKAQEARKAFLAEFAKTGDWEQATKTHLDPLGLGGLRFEAARWASKLKRIKSR